MRFQRSARAALAGGMLLCASVAAGAMPPGVTDCCAVPARTPVEIEIAAPISTRANRTGEQFPIRLAEPLIVDGHIVAPAGTPGVGEVVHSASAGGMGRAGELILAARYLQLGDRQIRLRSLRFRQQGRDSSGGVAMASTVAGAVVPFASFVGFLIQGGQVTVQAGTRAEAATAQAEVLPPVEAAQSNATTTTRGE